MKKLAQPAMSRQVRRLSYYIDGAAYCGIMCVSLLLGLYLVGGVGLLESNYAGSIVQYNSISFSSDPHADVSQFLRVVAYVATVLYVGVMVFFCVALPYYVGRLLRRLPETVLSWTTWQATRVRQYYVQLVVVAIPAVLAVILLLSSSYRAEAVFGIIACVLCAVIALLFYVNFHIKTHLDSKA